MKYFNLGVVFEKKDFFARNILGRQKPSMATENFAKNSEMVKVLEKINNAPSFTYEGVIKRYSEE